MIFGIELLILVAVIAFIGYPILRPAVAGGERIEGDAHHDLLYKRDTLYASLKDLEFDYKTGKIDDDDYANLKAGLEKSAIEVLKSLDGLKKMETDKKKYTKKSKGEFCSGCGELLSSVDRFCSSCGKEVS